MSEAFFARIDEQMTVIDVIVIPNEFADHGQEFISNTLGVLGTWLQTDMWSHGGIRYEEGTVSPSSQPHFRFNYAGVGYTYNEDLNAFVPPKPESYQSWTIDPHTALWGPPTPMPLEGGPWTWDEDTLSWVALT